MAKIKIGLDTSSIDALAKLNCFAMGCKHNTAQRSNGDDGGHCDYKHVSLDNHGKCTMYESLVETGRR